MGDLIHVYPSSLSQFQRQRNEGDAGTPKGSRIYSAHATGTRLARQVVLGNRPRWGFALRGGCRVGPVVSPHRRSLDAVLDLARIRQACHERWERISTVRFFLSVFPLFPAPHGWKEAHRRFARFGLALYFA